MTRFSKGLQGVIAGESSIGYVNGFAGILAYRGYPIDILAKHSTYMETAYLLLNKNLPTQKQLEIFSDKIKEKRKLPKFLIEMIRLFPKESHSMEALQAMLAALGSSYHQTSDQVSEEELKERAIELIAQFPLIVATHWRSIQGQEILSPNEKLDHSSNFIYMVTGKIPDKEGAKIFDTSMILHAEHSFNVSTFTARVVASSLPPLHSAISAAVGSLYGPLHGGANEHVLNMISDIKSVDDVEAWVLKKLTQKEKIMGMGHRIYQVKDPRSYILEEMLAHYATKKKDTRDFNILKKIETVMNHEMKKKGKDVWPNVDFFSGALYKLLGMPIPLFTPIFAIARIAGWCSHIIEQLEDNQLYRPVCEYVGPKNPKYIPIEKR